MLVLLSTRQDPESDRLYPYSISNTCIIYDRLYYLSEVSNTKLVAKFLEVGRINVIITRLRAALQRPRCTFTFRK